MKKVFALILCMLMMATNAQASNLSVCANLTEQTDALYYLNQIGSEYIRATINWSAVEKEKGVLAFANNEQDIIKNISDTGKNVIIILAFGNTLYTNNKMNMPKSSQSEYYPAWLNYVRFMANTFKDYNVVYEVWNEPNLKQFNADGSAAEYGQLFSDTYDLLKSIDTDAVVLGGSITGTSNTAMSFLEGFYKNGGNKMDALSFHCYTHSSSPEANYKSALSTLESKLDSLGYNGDVWMTENGYYTGTADNSKSEELQAAYTIRQTVIWEDYLRNNNRNGKNLWYDFFNDGEDQTYSEHNFGLITYDRKMKKSFYSVKTFNELLSRETQESLTIDGNTYIAKYTGGNQTTYVAWNTNGNASANLTFSGNKVVLYDYQGNKVNELTGTSATINVNQSPCFVDCITYETVIDSVNYNNDKSVATVVGRCNYKDFVTIEAELEGNILNTVKAKVKDGKFTADVSILKGGNIKIYAGRPEAAETYIFGERTITVNKAEEIPTVLGKIENVITDLNSGNVYISGSVTNTDECTVALVKNIEDLKNITKNDILYVGKTSVSNNSFSTQISVPKDLKENCRILIGGKNLESVYDSAITVGFGICDVATVVNGNEISVTGKFIGKDDISTIVVVPETTDLENIERDNIAYVGIAPITNNAFSHTFTLPDIYGGKYKMLLSSANASPETFAMQFKNAPVNARVCELEITGSDKLTVRADINNINAKANSAAVIIAQYDELGMLLDVKFSPIEIKANTVIPKSVTVNADKHQGTTKIKGFVFDSISGMVPLCGTVEK